MLVTSFLVLPFSYALFGQGSGLLNFQGRVIVKDSVFEGIGQFKFALVNNNDSTVLWFNSPDGDGDDEPDLPVSVPVTSGLYSILLGDTELANMNPIPAETFSAEKLYLRVWFYDQLNGYQQLTPDQRVIPSGYALMAGTVPDGAITTQKLAPDLFDNLTESISPSGLTVVSNQPQDAQLLAKEYIPFMSVPAPSWRSGPNSAELLPRFGHTAIWNGDSWIVWGGSLGGAVYSSSGASFSPRTGEWQVVVSLDAPSARTEHTAVWSGDSMLVWGGFGVDGYTNDGGSYILSKTEWSRIPSTGAPEGREGHVAVWTGKEMLIWGGSNYSGLLQNGGLYNPSLNTWRDLTIPNQPEARTGATSVWIGKELLIWGGMGANGPLNSGSKLVFDENGSPIEWRSISEIGAPLGRVDHTAVHSKTQMIIWGGKENGAVLADGGLYDPTSDTWKPITTEGAPEARHSHNAVWTGSEMVILNGANSNALYSSGGAYNPATEQWRELKNSGNPPARRGALVGWTGEDLLVYGGQGSSDQTLSHFWQVKPQPEWYFYRKP